MPDEVKQYIKSEILSIVGDPSVQIRKTVASIVTTIVVKGGLKNWPSLLPTLIQFLDSNDFNFVEGALQAFVLICEDYAHKLDSDEETSGSSIGRPLNLLIPKFINFFKSPQDIIRKHGISCVNQFIVDLPPSLLVNMDTYLQGLFYLSNDSSPEVRKRVCQAFVTLVEVRVDYLMPNIRNIVQFMLHATNDQDDAVSLEACEFWSAIAETKVCKEAVREHLPSLVPLLLTKMIYNEEDIEVGEEETVPDSEKDIKPFFASGKSKGTTTNGTTGNSTTTTTTTEEQEEEVELEEDESVNDDDFSEWNIRKCAAAGLDILSTVFQDEILPILLPVLQERLDGKNTWLVRESAILAIGAIAEGCGYGIKQFLPQLIPYLQQQLNDSEPLVRSITSWSLSRYSRWIVSQADTEKYFRPILFDLLQRILDTNKKVQEAACSAFATMEEEAQLELVPYLSTILRCLMTAYDKYQARNLLILYDAIGTLADSVGDELNNNELVGILMPPLIMRWNNLSDEDRNLLPLLECLTSIATALSTGFQPFAQGVYQRCVRLIEQTLIKENLARQNQGDFPDKEFMICALDLISGIADGLGPSIESLISNSNIVTLLFECMKDNRPDVRQSSFALVGDLAKSSIVHLKPLLHEYIPILTKNLHPDYVSVCNNASWALGEIAIKVGEDIKPFVPSIMERLLSLLNRSSLNRNLLENTAITLGRIGFVCPDVLAPNLAHFIQPWCLILRNIRDDIEKDSAFRGLCKLIKLNPNGIVNHFVYVCDAIGSWDNPKQDLKETFVAILHGFKNSMGTQWPDYYKAFPEPLQKVLYQKYNL